MLDFEDLAVRAFIYLSFGVVVLMAKHLVYQNYLLLHNKTNYHIHPNPTNPYLLSNNYTFPSKSDFMITMHNKYKMEGRVHHLALDYSTYLARN